MQSYQNENYTLIHNKSKNGEPSFSNVYVNTRGMSPQQAVWDGSITGLTLEGGTFEDAIFWFGTEVGQERSID